MNAILNRTSDTRVNTPSDTWCVPATLIVEQNKKYEYKWEAVLALDSQCAFNLISTLMVERENLVIEQPDRKHLATTITGQQIYSLGHIDIRVWCKVKVKPLLSGQPTFKPKYYKMRFLVVQSNNFEAIVGHRTMEEEHIYRDKDLICPFRTTAKSSGDIAAQQQAADERIRKESLRVAEDEKRRADQQQMVGTQSIDEALHV